MLAPDSFRAARWVRTLNLVLQAVLFLTFFGGLNYLARNHPSWRFDLTSQRKFSLSPETLSYLKSLDRPVRIVVSLNEENDSPQVRGLLEEFKNLTDTNPRGKIRVEYLDIYQNRRTADELGIDLNGLIVLLCGEKRRTLTIDELYRTKDQKRVAFQGEQTLTSAILGVSSRERQRIYFLAGHGELQPTDTNANSGLSRLRDELRARDFEVEALDLAVARRVPADASVVVAVSPTQGAFSRQEQEFLRNYLAADAGRLVLFLPPGRSVDEIGLADLLFDWGILVDNDIVVDTDPTYVTEDLDLIVSAFDETHPITQSLVNHKWTLRFGATRTVRPDPGRSPASGLTVVPVAAASRSAWGETHFREQPFALDAADIRPLAGIPPKDQLGIVVASERVSVRDNLPFSVRGGRLVVFGTGDLVSNQRIVNYGNLPVFLNTVNWCVDRDHLLNVPPRPIERFQLALSAAEFERLRYALLLGLPGATFLLGVIVYWTRRV